MTEITRDNIDIMDIEVNDELTGASSLIQIWFDVDDKFGTNVNNDENAWVNLYAEYFPDTKKLKCRYYVDEEDKSTEYDYTPTGKEKRVIISLMEEFAQENYGENIAEIIMEYQDNEMTMGGIS